MATDSKNQNEALLYELTKQLREEANFVKDCFTRFSFQSMAISTVVLGIIARYQADFPCVAFASTLVLVLILTVARIGTYKYSTANRNFGYQLHLERTKESDSVINHYCKPSRSDELYWSDGMRYIGWEEAMRSWRIVQATIFESIYKTHWFWPNKVRDEIGKKRYKWFFPKDLIPKTEASYYAGSYLKTMHAILHFIAALSIIPLIIMTCQYIIIKNIPLSLFGGFSIFISIIAFYWRVRKNSARRKILEYELLSIHSIAILWQAVVLAHYRAKRNAFLNTGTYKTYTENLSKQAIDLKGSLENIHEWIYG